MKKIILLFLLTPILIYAATGNNLGSETLSTYKIGTSAWYPIFKQASLYLFASLATIELITVFGMKALKNELEFSSIIAELIKITLIFGLFKIFYDNPAWMDAIFQGFSTLGNQANAAAGASTIISIDDLTDSAAELLAAINENQSWWKPADSIVLGLIGLIAALTILFLGIELLVAYVKFLLYLNLSVLFFAFGAFGYTRQWAYNAVTNIIKSGVEYMLIKLVIGLTIANIKTQAPIAMKAEGSLFALLITVLMIFGIIRMIHPIVESFFSGAGAANSGSLGGMAKGAMMGAGAAAVGGGAAAIAQIKDANSAADAAGTSKVGKGRSMAGVAGGVMAGMATGMAKGGFGFNTNSAGGTSGGKVASMAVNSVNKASSAALKAANTESKQVDSNKNTNEKSKTEEPTLKPGDKGYYHSSVPPQKEQK